MDYGKIEPSFFELTVAMAFDYFAHRKVDVAVVEVGLGGRLDSTNIITPELSIITNIGLDHTALLGDSLGKIAAEKAGIIKAGIPAVIGTTQPETKTVFDEVAALKLAPLFFADQEFTVAYSLSDTDGNQLVAVEKNGDKIYPQLKLDLKGMYQQKNLPAVLKTVELLRQMGWNILDEHLLYGLANTKKMTG
jgi:dihydrofolate synthase / folylpolyglutamate synthase